MEQQQKQNDVMLTLLTKGVPVPGAVAARSQVPVAASSPVTVESNTANADTSTGKEPDKNNPTPSKSTVVTESPSSAAVAATCPPRSAPQQNVMRPKEYDGKESIDSYLTHFEVCAKYNKWSDDEKRLWLQWALKDRSRQVLWDMPNGIERTYSELTAALRQRFGSDHQQEVYKLELANRRRRPGESLSDLMQDIRRLMVLGYSLEQSSIWEAVATNAFLAALNDTAMALEIRKRSPATLDAVYRDAVLLEGYYKASQSDKGPEKGGGR